MGDIVCYHRLMPQLLVRNVSVQAVQALKRRAAENGRSVEAEHRALLEAVAVPPGEDVWERARRFREELAATGRAFRPSEEIVREIRAES